MEPTCIHYFALFNRVISAGSMMVNVIAPIIKEFDERWGIEMISATFVADPAPAEDMQLGSIAAGQQKAFGDSAEALDRIFPKLKGRIAVSKFPVRLYSGASACAFVIKLHKRIDKDSFKAFVKEKKDTDHIGWTMEKVTAQDVKGAKKSCTVSLRDTKIVGEDLVRLVGFYDRDFAYATRVVDLIKTERFSE